MNKITKKIEYIGMPDRIHSYLKFQVLSDIEKSNLIELGYQIAQNSKARFNLVKANEKMLKKFGITIKLRRSTLGSGTVPTFTPLGNAMFLKNGKLGNGEYFRVTQEGFSIGQINSALEKIKKYKGVAEDIKLTGGRPSDFNHVWDAWGIDRKLGNAIYDNLNITLHHMDDVSKQTKGTFELVHTPLHKASLSHTGNFGIFETILDLIK